MPDSSPITPWGPIPGATGTVQAFPKTITAALNAGATVVATITSQTFIVTKVIIHAITAAHADMTTCAVTGGASGVVTFIGTDNATEANLNAIDKQVSWEGAVRLEAGETISMNLVGAGSTAADLKVSVSGYAEVDGGYLA